MKKIALTAAVISALSGPALAQSAENGEKVFKKCKACHQVGEKAKNRTGPILTNVIGRPAGSVEGFKYSGSMIAAGETGLIWAAGSIAEYITDPTKYLRSLLDDPKAKAKMTFKLKKEQDRLDVIAYLATFQTAAMSPTTPADGFCVTNATETRLLFATETREGDRQLAELAPGDSLCATGTTASDGIVSVFEDENGFEGCSRVITVGTSETMTEYAEFDRCGWSSHKS